MKLPVLIICTLLSLACLAQEVVTETVTSSGGTHVQATFQIDWTIGESVTETFINGTFQLTQGIHQGFYTVVLTVPVVETSEPIVIDINSAIVGGCLLSNGGSAITNRGIYFGIDPEPVTTGTNIPLGTGSGTFSITIDTLDPGMTFYVVAYATNSEGTAFGEEKNFSTLTLPSVISVHPAEITDTTAIVGGEVICEGGLTVSSCGVYWGLYPEPELTGSRLDIGEGLGSYYLMLQDLVPETTYFVKAFAENELGTAFGDLVMFETLPTQGGVPASLVLSNLSITSTQDTCFSATEIITVAGDGTLVEIMDGGYLQLIAGQTIMLKDGFRVYAGGGFHAFIDTEGNYCLNSKSIIATSTKGELPDIQVPGFVDQKAFFTAYPNPTSGLFTIRLTDANEAVVKVEVYSMLGELLITNDFHSEQQFEMDLSDRSQGIYIIRVLCGDKFGTEKMIKR